MRIAETVIEGRFLRRDNRFRVSVEIDGRPQAAHLPNSGRLGELLLPGAPAALVPRSGGGRRTAFDMVQVFAQGRWISTDSRLPNRLVADALKKRELPGLDIYTSWRSEPRIDEGRLDFALQKDEIHAYVEVKSVTLVRDRTALFPDAPTERGVRHLNALARLSKEGADAHVLFIIQRDDADCFMPNGSQDAAFAKACRSAAKAGVDFRAYCCATDFGSIELADVVPVILN